ncbi:MAG: hypothetical protein UW92_C0002G0042 [Candidatus Jorgensenbacteria bacterium GW2011_GWA2_45_13]|uniref:Uncharacterized protein n=1 Tax=Candidatus Jorgensenbacteria bacterium GW2011_GWA2_45_13 TaxID=1618662 RepID=A0A0G1L9G9_9BACT|nr:MAG: hypothetical protein UW92_C0002G0042 [Candidatus Jorgensenbacteria bacterium GW2011_GWA2_45_13]
MATGKKTILISGDAIKRLEENGEITVVSSGLYSESQILEINKKNADSIRATIRSRKRVEGSMRFFYTLILT